jgi:hypothetical protein
MIYFDTKMPNPVAAALQGLAISLHGFMPLWACDLPVPFLRW